MSYARFESLESRRYFAAVTSLTLLNADTDQPVVGLENFVDGAVLDLATLPTTRLNVLANVTADVSSVNFGYDANPNHQLENNAPFAFASDAGGDFKPWTPALGTHTMTVTPYTADNRLGTAGEAVTVTFTVISTPEPEPEPAPGPAVTGLTLINATNDQPIAGYENLASGAVLDLATLPTTALNVLAHVTPDVSSVNFGYDGNPNHQLENTAPFAFASDAGGDFKPWTPTLGSHTITVTPYTADNRLGTAGQPRVITFTVISTVPDPEPEPEPQPGPTVTGLTLINADTNQPVAGYTDLTSDMVLDLAALPTTRLNVRANVGSGVASVRFAYDGNANFRTENVAPYAFAGDTYDEFDAWTPALGAHTLKATAYSAASAGGVAGSTRTVTFTVVSGGPVTAPTAPVVTPAPIATTGLRFSWPAPP